MRAPRRGFTLIELLVGVAVASFVLLGISFAFISQARQYQAHASRRSIQANARQAMAFMERTLRRAGFGVDPDRAVVPYDAYDAGTNAQVAGYPDAIAIHSRDPLFRRTASKVLPSQLTLSTALNEPLYVGQILLVLCPGARTYAYVTVGAKANKGDSIVNLDSTTPVDSPRGMPAALFHQQAQLSNACFSAGDLPWVVKVNRSAFYVASFDEDNKAGTANAIPYLMMHQGLDISGPSGVPDGVVDDKDAVPVAEGIEQLQLAYILNVLHTTVGTDEVKVPRIVGMDNLTIPLSGSPVTWPYGEKWQTTFTADAPSYQDPYDSPQRVTAHPANIRQVRVTLVSRSNVPDPQLLKDPKYNGDNALTPGETWASGTFGATPTWAQLENLGTPATAAFDPRGRGFYRVVLRQTIVPKNMLSRSQFLPVTQGGG